eukprot:scaffold40430_cov26-Prasinocladus_malaysianus.AAC.6
MTTPRPGDDQCRTKVWARAPQIDADESHQVQPDEELARLISRQLAAPNLLPSRRASQGLPKAVEPARPRKSPLVVSEVGFNHVALKLSEWVLARIEDAVGCHRVAEFNDGVVGLQVYLRPRACERDARFERTIFHKIAFSGRKQELACLIAVTRMLILSFVRTS